MISIQHLDFSYGKNRVIQSLDWQLEPGKVHGLVGMNGSGKTTLFNLMAGWLKPAAGSILYAGKPVSRQTCAFMETAPQFYPMITGKEYLDLFRLKNPGFDIGAWNQVFALPLQGVVDNYSTGMQKKLSLMGIIAMNREILILDEPFNGLDFETVRIVRQIIASLALKSKTVILSSHIPESLTTVCDSISLINSGKIAFMADKGRFSDFDKLVGEFSPNRSTEIPL